MRGEVREASDSNRVAEHQLKLNRKVKGFGLTGRITRHSSIAAPAASKSDLWKSGRRSRLNPVVPGDRNGPARFEGRPYCPTDSERSEKRD